MTAAEVLIYCERNTANILEKVEKLKNEPIHKLQWKSSSEHWSVLECLEHLNLYADFYNPAIRTAMQKSQKLPSTESKPGLLGGYFAKSMLPQKNMKKMKTFKDKNPIHSSLSEDVMHRFIQQQHEFLSLIKLAENKDLNSIKTPITITRLLKLKLGDTMQFLVNHNLRHFQQIEKCLAAQK